MSAWKPKIWKSGCMWICSYYRNSIAGAYGGSTPAEAYAAWKWTMTSAAWLPAIVPPLTKE